MPTWLFALASAFPLGTAPNRVTRERAGRQIASINPVGPRELSALPLEQRLLRNVHRALRAHRAFIDVTYEDARRLRDYGWRNSYLLDWELLFRYMYEGKRHPEGVAQLRYLFDAGQHTFVFGPGTLIELADRQRQIFGFDFMTHLDGLSADPQRILEDVSLDQIRDKITRLLRGPRRDTELAGLGLIHDLIGRPNVLIYPELAGLPDVSKYDRALYLDIVDQLAARRPDARPITNIADALNIVTVIELRRLAVDGLRKDFFFLLTTTSELRGIGEGLFDPSYSWGFDGAVARRPDEALYSDVVEQGYPDPGVAMEYTVNFVVEIAKVEAWLRSSPSLSSQARTAAELKRSSPDRLELMAHLRELAGVLEDVTLNKAQALLEAAAEVHAASIPHFDRSTLEAAEVFDHARRLTTALRARAAGNVADAFEVAIDASTKRTPDEVRIAYASASNATAALTEFLLFWRNDSAAVEACHWPARTHLPASLGAMSTAYERYGLQTVQAIVAAGNDVLEFDVDLPFNYLDLLSALDACQKTPLSISWLRFVASPFDIQLEDSSQFGHLGLLTVLGATLDLVHLEDFYRVSAKQLLLDDWVTKMFLDLRYRLGRKSAG